jgi:hypothetical protein
MTFAHQGVELKAIPFVDPPFEKPQSGVAVARTGEPIESVGARAASLSAATSERLTEIESLMRKAAGLKPLAALAPSAQQPLTEIAGGAVPR